MFYKLQPTIKHSNYSSLLSKIDKTVRKFADMIHSALFLKISDEMTESNDLLVLYHNIHQIIENRSK